MNNLMVPLLSLPPERIRAWARRQMAKIEAEAREQERAAERADELDRKGDGTKPLIYVDRSDPVWPIVVVGAGVEYRGDMRDLARRRRETQRYRTPDNRPRNAPPDPDLTLRTVADMRLRELRGTRTFHIKNNPLALALARA